MKRYTAAEKRQWRAQLEHSAVMRLVAHLRQQGEEVEICDTRPDEVNRDGPEVDFEFTNQGRSIGVEVTQLIPAARSHYEISAIQRHIQEATGSIPEQRQLGVIALEVDYGVLPRAADMDRDVAVLVTDVRKALESLAPDQLQRVEVPVRAKYGTFRRVRLRRFESSDHRLTFITASGEWGGWIRPMAEDFVDRLLNTKPAQTARWDEAWIVVLDRIGLVGSDDLVDVLSARYSRLPSNWTRIYFLPAADGVPIVEMVGLVSPNSTAT